MPRQSMGSYPPPAFTPDVVADQLRDGYWVDALDIDHDGRPDLIGYGLTLGEIYWYRNPDWERRLVASRIREPVGGALADITGNGRLDLMVCYDLYGPGGTIRDPHPEGGKIDWIEHPDDPMSGGRWNRYHIGNVVGTHRLGAGHFTQTEKLELVALPIVAMEGMHGLLPVTMFTRPDDVRDAKEWPASIIDDTYFRMIHGAVVKPHPMPGSGLDSLLISSDEGVTRFWYDTGAQRWRHDLIGVGELGKFDQTGFRGAGDADAGRIGDDPFAYVAAVEPFHGNTVAVYTKDPEYAGDPDAPAERLSWRRTVLDTFGVPNENGEGPCHSVVCADFDGDGDDEFLLGMRGPEPWQGVFYYKAVDLANGVFVKWRVSTESTSRIVPGDFNGDGTLDFATIVYKVPHYYEATDAKIVVHHNQGRPGA